MSDTDIEAEFAALLRRGGVTVAPDRVPVMLESYRRYLEMARVLNEPMGYTDEPAVALHLQPTGRAL